MPRRGVEDGFGGKEMGPTKGGSGPSAIGKFSAGGISGVGVGRGGITNESFLIVGFLCFRVSFTKLIFPGGKNPIFLRD